MIILILEQEHSWERQLIVVFILIAVSGRWAMVVISMMVVVVHLCVLASQSCWRVHFGREHWWGETFDCCLSFDWSCSNWCNAPDNSLPTICGPRNHSRTMTTTNIHNLRKTATMTNKNGAGVVGYHISLIVVD
jgi:hypothetical protein